MSAEPLNATPAGSRAGVSPESANPAPVIDEAQAAQRAAALAHQQAQQRLLDSWLDAVLMVAAHYQIDTSRERLRVDAAWAADGMSSEDLRHCMRQMAQQAGLAVTEVAPDLARLTAWRLPVAVQLRGGQVAVVTALT